MHRWIRTAFVLAAAALLGGCAVGYYAQAVVGHLDLVRAQRPVHAVIADPSTPPELARRLERAASIRRFASEELALPDNDSYTQFVQLERDAVVWNVVAVPEFSLQPHHWCVPVAGCLSYRGYFSRQRAAALASRFAARGHDTLVAPVSAYSTLGRLSDPLLSTMLVGNDADLAAVIFHELAHQQLYVAGDTAFNEAFAVTVEQYGTRRWLQSEGETGLLAHYEQRLQRREVLDLLIARQRERLQAIYDSGRDEAWMRREKALAFARMRGEYVDHRAAWDDGPNLDAWFNRPLGNAHLMAVAAYRDWVPAFERLLDEAEDIAAFYRKAKALAGLPPDQRASRLARLTADTLP